MNKILRLVKADLNAVFSPSTLKYKMKNKDDRIQLIILAIALLSLAPAYLLLVSGLSDVYYAFFSIGQKSMFLLTGILLCQFIILIFGILQVMSKYYFSNDLNILVPLPLKPKEIISAKFISSLIYEYITLLFIFLPFIIIYGVNGSEGILYWIYSIIVFFLVPIIPLTIASIIVMVFMRYTNIKGKKDLLRIVGYIVLIVVMIAIQMKIQSMAQQSIVAEEDFLYSLMTNSELLLRRLGIASPPSMWGALTLSGYDSMSGILYLLLLLLVSALAVILMIFLSDKVFFKGLIGNMEVSISSSKSKVKAKDFNRRSPPYLAIAMKEIKMLVRTPVYLMNSIGGVILLPILILLPMFIEGDEYINTMREMTAFNNSFVSLIGVAFVAILGVINSVCSTTFSREGKNMWIQRTLPINTKDQIIGRLLSSIFVQIIGIIGIYGVLAYMGALSIEGVVIIAALGLLASIPTGEIGLIIDAYRPNLSWDDPQVAMKQNLNVLINMGIGGLYVFGVSFLAYKLINIVNIWILYLIIAFIFIVSSLVLYKALEKIIKFRFENLE